MPSGTSAAVSVLGAQETSFQWTVTVVTASSAPWSGPHWWLPNHTQGNDTGVTVFTILISALG